MIIFYLLFVWLFFSNLKEFLFKILKFKKLIIDGENNNTNNIPENAADIISPNLQESMRSNNQRAAIINHQKHK